MDQTNDPHCMPKVAECAQGSGGALVGGGGGGGGGGDLVVSLDTTGARRVTDIVYTTLEERTQT